MNIVVTGGCGFIGTNLVKKLVSLGHVVNIVDNLSKGTIKYVPKNVAVYTDDIKDYIIALDVCHDADVVIHLAANTGIIPSIEKPEKDCFDNVVGTFNYIDAARMCNVKHFIFASTGAVLGEQEPPLNENMVPKPLSPYGASKLAGEAYCSAYYGSFGLNTTTLRFSNVYGPYSLHKSNNLIPKFINCMKTGEAFSIYGDGKQTRDFIYVDDLVDAIIQVLSCEYTGGEVFQIATQVETSVIEMTTKLNILAKKYFGVEVPLNFVDGVKGEVRKNHASIDKAKKYLNFYLKYSLDFGLDKTVKWFKDNI